MASGKAPPVNAGGAGNEPKEAVAAFIERAHRFGK